MYFFITPQGEEAGAGAAAAGRHGQAGVPTR